MTQAPLLPQVMSLIMHIHISMRFLSRKVILSYNYILIELRSVRALKAIMDDDYEEHVKKYGAINNSP